MNNKLIISILTTIGLISFSCQSIELDPTKTYYIDTSSTGRYLADDGVIKSKYGGPDDSKSWVFTEVETDWYSIQNKTTLKFLQKDASGNVVPSDYVNNSTFKWQLIEDGSPFYYIVNKYNNKSITSENEEVVSTDPDVDVVYHAKDDTNGTIRVNDYAGLAEQKWRIEEVKFNQTDTIALPAIGWTPNQKKYATLSKDTNITPPTFTVSGTSTLSGSMTYAGEHWNRHFYRADLSALTTVGSHTISADGQSSDFTIADSTLTTLTGSSGNISYDDIFRGFWDYQRLVAQSIPEATMYHDVNGEEAFTFTGNNANITAYGWYDAHSRDAKISRIAMVISELSLAALSETNAADKASLLAEITFGAQHLLDMQNADGSWPLGKVRNPEDRNTYFWIINKDTGAAAKAVRALALTYQVLNASNSAFATTALNAAKSGYDYVVANEEPADFDWDILERPNWSGGTVDVLGAAVEMAYATNENKYFTKADEIVNDGNFVGGVWKKINGAFAREYEIDDDELETGSVVYFARYYNIAKTDAIKSKISLQASAWYDYWANQSTTPFHVPMYLTSFGQVQRYGNLAKGMIHLYDTFTDFKALELATFSLEFILGANPFSTSFIEGLGDNNSAPFFKRSYSDAIGALNPGIRRDYLTETIWIDFGKYQSGEGTIISSSQIFDIISKLRNASYPVEAIPSETPANLLIRNGDLEQGLTFWSDKGNSDLSIDTNVVYQGLMAAKSSNRDSVSDSAQQGITQALSESGTGNYIVSGWVKNDAVTSDISLKISINAGGVTTYSGIDALNVGTTWTQLKKTIPLNWSGNLDAATVYFKNTDLTADFYVDDIFIVKEGELINNGGYEDGLNAWDSKGTAVLSQAVTDTHSGLKAIKVSERTLSYSSAKQDITKALLANGTGEYEASAWVKNQTSTSDISLKIKLTYDGGISKYFTVTRTSVNSTWQEIAGIFNLTWTGSLESAELYFNNTDTTNDFYIDDIAISKIPLLLKNGDLEDGTTDWNGKSGSTISAETTNVHSGSGSLLTSGRDSASDAPQQYITAGLQYRGPNTYNFSAWVKNSTVTSDISLKLKLTYDGGQVIYHTITQSNVDTNWSQISGSLALSWSTLEDAELYFHNTNINDNFYIDDVLVTLE